MGELVSIGQVFTHLPDALEYNPQRALATVFICIPLLIALRTPQATPSIQPTPIET
jgi:hypothetical protein